MSTPPAQSEPLLQVSLGSGRVEQLAERISDYKEFKRCVVAADFEDFMADRANLRKAWHCAGSLFHLADWVYAAHKSSIDVKYQYVTTKELRNPWRAWKISPTPLAKGTLIFSLFGGLQIHRNISF